MCRFKYFQKLTVKDYAIIGIYSLLILVIQIVLGIFSSPFLLYSYVLFCGPVSFLAAPIYILMAVKVGKSGVAFIFNIIRGLMFVAFGAPMLMILFIISGIFAELALLGETGYKTQLRQTISWTISSVFYGVHLIFMAFLFRGTFVSMIGEETFNTVAVYLTDPMWIAISIVTVVFFAILGGLLSARLMKKHFRRSGVVGVTS